MNLSKVNLSDKIAPFPMKTILVIDDDEDSCRLMQISLSERGYRVVWTTSGTAAGELIRKESPSCILLDLNLRDTDGLSVLNQIKGQDKNLPVIMLTGADDVVTAVEAMKRGAFHYMAKSAETDELLVILAKAIEQRDLYKQVEDMRVRLGEVEDLEAFMGSSERIQKVIRLIRSVSATDVNVLLSGESGTGKELVARIIHHLSNRRDGPFVPIDCASIPETLIESELFGYEKGAFTGASEARKGKFEVANNGTLFLDEVPNIPSSVQAKLLRFLERHDFERIGGRTPIHTSVRIVAATNVDLSKTSKEGQFRLDLFFRLNEFPIHLPPLRKRREDIPFLCKKLMVQLQREVGREIAEISPEALEKLKYYEFPGNVRELRNILKRAMVVADKRIEINDLNQELWSMEDLKVNLPPDLPLANVARDRAGQVEKQMIIDALKKTDGHREKAAQLLGITPRTLYNKIKLYEIEP